MWQSLLWIVTILVIIGLITSALTFPATLEWYPSLNKPCWAVSADIIGIMWPVFYFLIGLSTYIAYESVFDVPARTWLFITFTLIVILIPTFAYLTFYRRAPGAGLIILILLLIVVIAQIYISLNCLKNVIAGALLAPLAIWIVYLILVFASIISCNPGTGICLKNPLCVSKCVSYNITERIC